MHDVDGQPADGALRPDERAFSIFGETADPDGYLPRDATEAALERLVRAVLDAREPAGLTAPPGMGKTLLLQRLAQRLGEARCCVYLPYGAMSQADLCAWALGRLGRPHVRPEGPVRALASLARRLADQGRGLVLLIDDAGSMPLETARDLVALSRLGRGALGLVLATNDDAIGSRLLATAGPVLCEVRFIEPMNTAETAAYVARRLERAGVPEPIRSRFDAATVAWLHRMSGGIPRRLHEFANEILEHPADDVRTRLRDEPGVGEVLDDIGRCPPAEPGLDLPLEYDLDECELEED